MIIQKKKQIVKKFFSHLHCKFQSITLKNEYTYIMMITDAIHV